MDNKENIEEEPSLVKKLYNYAIHCVFERPIEEMISNESVMKGLFSSTINACKQLFQFGLVASCFIPIFPYSSIGSTVIMANMLGDIWGIQKDKNGKTLRDEKGNLIKDEAWDFLGKIVGGIVGMTLSIIPFGSLVVGLIGSGLYFEEVVKNSEAYHEKVVNETKKSSTQPELLNQPIKEKGTSTQQPVKPSPTPTQAQNPGPEVHRN